MIDNIHGMGLLDDQGRAATINYRLLTALDHRATF